MAEGAGAGPSLHSEVMGAAANGAVTNLNALSAAADRTGFAGQPVRLSGVEVQQVFSDRLLTVGRAGQAPLFVRIAAPVGKIEKGDRIDLTGVIKRVPASASASGTESSRPDADAPTLAAQSIYVEAARVEVKHE